MNSIGRISCLCITKGRVDLLARSIECFRRQTFQPCELLVLFESEDLQTRNRLSTFKVPQVRFVEVPSAGLTLGDLRNMSINEAQGEFIAQWDDDDWYAPERLAAQMSAIESTGKSACVLSRWTMFDMATKQAYLSAKRPWEGSLVARRSSLLTYPSKSLSEEVPVIVRLAAANQLALLDRPDLYIYVQHGGNAWPRRHWEENLVRYATKLPLKVSRRVASHLDGSATH